MSEPEERPTRCESARLRRAIVLATVVAVGTSVVGTAFSPYLLTHAPALLVLLSPEPRHIVLTANLLDGVTLIALGTIRRALGLVALYAFGWAYGQRAVELVERRYGRAGRGLRWAEKGVARFGIPLVLVLPMPVVALMAGVAGTRFRWTALAFTVGQLFWVSLTWALGDELSAFTTPILDFITAHLVELTVVCVVLVLVWQLRAWRRGRVDG